MWLVCEVSRLSEVEKQSVECEVWDVCSVKVKVCVCMWWKMNRYTIDLGGKRFRKSIRLPLAEAIISQYNDLKLIEGPRVRSLLSFQGTKFQINYTTRYLVGFISQIFFLLIKSMDSSKQFSLFPGSYSTSAPVQCVFWWGGWKVPLAVCALQDMSGLYSK